MEALTENVKLCYAIFCYSLEKKDAQYWKDF